MVRGKWEKGRMGDRKFQITNSPVGITNFIRIPQVKQTNHNYLNPRVININHFVSLSKLYLCLEF